MYICVRYLHFHRYLFNYCIVDPLDVKVYGRFVIYLCIVIRNITFLIIKEPSCLGRLKSQFASFSLVYVHDFPTSRN